jgi:acyl-CoA synthetase (AMP-forming)/AMP-acid ligase II
MREVFEYGFARADPQRAALIDIESGTRLTFGQLEDRSTRLMTGLLDLGLRRGDRVLILLRNCAEYFEIDLALAQVGLVRVPVMYGSTSSDLAYFAKDSGASAIFFHGEKEEIVAHLCSSGDLRVEHAICVDAATSDHVVDYEALIAGGSLTPALDELDGDDIFGIRYTAGTTGQGKGVVHTQAAWAQLVTLLLRNVNLGQYIRPGEETHLCIHPMSHAAAMEVHRYFVAGATNVVLDGLDPEKVFRTVQQERVTSSFMVPTGINKLVADPRIADYDLSSLETVYYGASPMPEGVLRRAVDALGLIFVQYYGSSEVPEASTILHKTEHDLQSDGRAVPRFKSTGRPAFGVQVKIVDENGLEMQPGASGEICLRSPAMLLRYSNNEELTAQRIVDGWFRQGDIGHLDDEGYLYIMDRKEDMIITGGGQRLPSRDRESDLPACRRSGCMRVRCAGRALGRDDQGCRSAPGWCASVAGRTR